MTPTLTTLSTTNNFNNVKNEYWDEMLTVKSWWLVAMQTFIHTQNFFCHTKAELKLAKLLAMLSLFQ